MRLRFNVQGLLGIAAIAVMAGVVFVRQWQIPWLYFGASVLFYSGAVIALSVWQEEERGKQETLRHELAGPHQREALVVVEEINESRVVMFTLFRALLGCHLAFALQALGILADTGDGESVVVRIGIFLAALAIGLAVPFLLLSRREDHSDGRHNERAGEQTGGRPDGQRDERTVAGPAGTPDDERNR